MAREEAADVTGAYHPASPMDPDADPPRLETLEIRVRGRVQGVGFRPNAVRIARELGVTGEVLNDGDGVLIRASGTQAAMSSFVDRLARDPPPRARVDAVETSSLDAVVSGDFRVVTSATGASRTEIAPDAVVCRACATEVTTPGERRFRYPFATCTHCGPRLTVVRAVPFDRSSTTLAGFALCGACRAEHDDVADRRFHAETIACPRCGPRARLVRFDGRPLELDGSPAIDDLEAARRVLERGEILAIKGLGGYQLACDATRADVVERLRERKRRDAKPFALMARDLDVVRRYASVSAEEARLLASPEGPVVLLDVLPAHALPLALAGELGTLGFMLPTTPLHVLLLEHLDRAVVMTSGNAAGEPPIVDDAEALAELGAIADACLLHDRPIENRVDDSVARVVDGRARLLRRARGYAPSALRLPPGFDAAPPLVAYGGDLKATFCLLDRGEASLSQHLGDLDEPRTADAFARSLTLFAELRAHRPELVVVDHHPGYVSSRLGRARALDERLALEQVQHHHAHAAACLAENAWPLDGPKVLAIVLDGLGLGQDGELWGGELLLVDYREARRLGTLAPVALLGGDAAARQPWRSLYAHLSAAMEWDELTQAFGALEIHRLLSHEPRAILDRMLATGIQSPRASSCGRLFDAVAAATGIAFERQAFEGQAAMLLEASIEDRGMQEGDELVYPFSISDVDARGVRRLEPAPMWRALLGDLLRETPRGVIAARFHRGLARALAAMVLELRSGGAGFDTVALSGGCFQNRVLFLEVSRRIRAEGLTVLGHSLVPSNDGGLSLGQAVIAAARAITTMVARR